MRQDITPWNRTLGSTGLGITAVTVGGSPLGSMPNTYGYEVAREDGIALVEAVLASPIRALDTANGYSDGESERRVGEGIARAGGLPDDYLIITKVDSKGRDYSGDRVRRSVEESLDRLGMSTLPLVHLHDPEFFDWATMTASGGAIDALVDLRDQGVIDHLGLAGGDTDVADRYLDLGVFEVLLVHNRWTLVDRSAQQVIERARSAGMGVVNAAVYGGGILAAPRSGSTSYGYGAASPATLDAITAMADVCERFATDLGTAALQFSIRDSRIDSTIVGTGKRSRLDDLITAAQASLPDELWPELEALVPPEENWLDRH